jgi:hypothetical protein
MPTFTCPGCWGQLFLADPGTVIICPRCGTRTAAVQSTSPDLPSAAGSPKATERSPPAGKPDA